MGAACLIPADAKGAKELNGVIWGMIGTGQIDRAFDRLAPMLERAVPFRLLDILATRVVPVSRDTMGRFLEKMAATRTMGGWVIYPQLVVPWLEEQALQKRRPQGALMLRKAITYFPDGDKAALMGHSQKPRREG